MKTNSRGYLVSVVMQDRVGIIRDATGALFALGANLCDLRQGVMGGQFFLHAIAEFPGGEPGGDARQAAGRLERAVRDALPEKDASVGVRPCAAEAAGGERAGRYVAAVSGPDSPGRLHRIAKVFAAHSANVEDWRHDFSDPAHTLTVGIVTLPAGIDVATLQRELEKELSGEGLSTSLLHENIFRATNEVGPIASLLGETAAVSRNSPGA